MTNKSFYWHFKKNMKDLGLVAPESLFGTSVAAIGTISTLVGALDKHGPHTTIRHIVMTGGVGAAGAAITVAGRSLLIAGSVAASFYVGACIGSFIVATHRRFGDRLCAADFVSMLVMNDVQVPVWIYRAHDQYRNAHPKRHKVPAS